MGKAWGIGLGGGRKDGYGSREVYISTKGAILGFARDLILEGFQGPRRGSQIVPWAAEERVPELALAHNHTEYEFIITMMNILHITIEPSSGDGWR